MNSEETLQTGPTISDHLKHFQEIKLSGEPLELEYWRPIHKTWNSMNPDDQLNFIVELDPEAAADFLRMMLGEPSHSLQPRNQQTWNIFETVLEYVPGAFMVIQEDKLPSWIDIVHRFNIHEDNSFDRALDIIKWRFYSSAEDFNWWPFHEDRAKKRAFYRR